ncbi:MAG: GTP-binding DUF697 domain-containing protein, partial [Methylovulum sp.]|nr:GTP-binding DUF697 domain-containing protein [Methylovulum sp.]
TQRSHFYDFPSVSHPILRFLDTRGLGESAYDPAEDLAWCAHQAQLLIVVLKATDMNQLDVLNTVKTIHAKHSHWPIIVVQTTLHEAYPTLNCPHILPYPYQDTALPATVPHALTQALAHQRAWFKGLPVHFVPVDFTLPEDGFEPVNYGLEALWDTIESVLPIGLLSLLRGSDLYKEWQDFYAQQAHPHCIGYALLNVGMGAIPLAGVALALAVQAKLFHSIASIYGLELTGRVYAEFTTLMGAGVLVGWLGRELLSLVPVYGWAVAGVYSGAMTYALGQAFCVYLHGVKKGALPDHTTLKHAYNEAFTHARQLLKKTEA